MSNLRLPAVVHFVSDGKPWKILAMEYLNMTIPQHTLIELKKQEYVHVYWRLEYFKATGDIPPEKTFFGGEADEVFKPFFKNNDQINNSKNKKNKKSSSTNFIEKLEIIFQKSIKYNKDNPPENFNFESKDIDENIEEKDNYEYNEDYYYDSEPIKKSDNKLKNNKKNSKGKEINKKKNTKIEFRKQGKKSQQNKQSKQKVTYQDSEYNNKNRRDTNKLKKSNNRRKRVKHNEF